MNTSDKSPIDVTLPGAATDFIKAIRELFGLVKDVVDGGKWMVDIYQGEKKKKAASNLNRLRFTKSETKPFLEKIIAGESTAADIEAIGRLMADSAGEVETSIAGLTKYRKVVRETYGMEASERLENMIDGPTGKRAIRYSLNNLVDAARQPNANLNVVRDNAKQALGYIERLNVDFREFHDLILGIKSESASATKKSNAKKKR